MKKTLFMLFLLPSIFLGQNKFTVYFDSDSHQLKHTELIRLDDFLKNKDLKITKVIGYCDYRASNGYNDTLAWNRANFVNGIIDKVTRQQQVVIESKGKNFEQSADLSQNRKVEIYFDAISEANTKTPASDIKISSLLQQVATAKVGDKLVLKNLYFYDRSSKFRTESLPVIKELVTILLENPKLKIEIQGHICCQVGADVENTAKFRALAVYNYLITNGIEADRLRHKSFGSTRPLHKIPEKTEEERNENRRVEIQIIEN